MARWFAAFNSIRVRLLVNALILVVAPLALLGAFVLRAVEEFYVQRQIEAMHVEATLLGNALAADVLAGRSVEATRLITNPPDALRRRARVRLFDNDGRLLVSSLQPEATPPADRPGLDSALQGRTSDGTVFDAAEAQTVAYVAQPLRVGSQQVGVIYLTYILSDIQAELNELRLIIVIATGLLAVLGVMLSLELSRRITRPLDTLGAATREIAGGRFEHRVDTQAPTELAGLAATFNRMAADLDQAEQARRAAFANIAHDVRTPLGSIRAAAEALVAGASEQPELRDRLTAGILQQVGYLRHFSDDLLRLASYESGGLRLNRASIQVGPVLAQAAETLQPVARDQSVSIEIQPSPDLPPVSADGDRVVEVLLNLLDNALRYTPTGGAITLGAEGHESGVRVWVRDTGPGIPPDQVDHVFDRFRRGDLRRTGSGLNMGLGLNIAHLIVTAHGGQIRARNLEQGGAEFYFTLPSTPPVPPGR